MSAVIEFPPPAEMLTMNQRMHWAPKSRLAAQWRGAAYYASIATAVSVRRNPVACMVTVELPVKGNRRRDPHNWFPTVKPIIDGLVDAGVWPDDTPEWVTCTEPRLVVGGDMVRVVLTEREVTS